MMSQTRNTRGRENFAQPHLIFTNDDLLTKILIRLPILCIHLFTTVSKQWLQILTSHHFTDRRRKIPILDPPACIFANHLRSLFEYDFVSLDPRLESRKSAMDNSFTLGSNEKTYHVNILQSCNGLRVVVGGRLLFITMAFDPTKSRDYKVVQLFACLHAQLEIQVYSSKTGNWSMCRDRGSNFLQSFGGREGSYDPMFIQIDIHAILHMQRRLFELHGCLLLVSRDDIDSKEFTIYEMVKGCLVWTVRDDIDSTEFTIYEMMKGCSVWSVRYLINIVQLLNPLPEGWSIRTGVWSICLGEGEEDGFVVINLSGKVVKYNLISKTNTEIFDIGSNQMDDDDDADDDAVLFILPFEVDPNLYELIPSLASV
ncbi:hypothetical protein Tco_1320729 [Tanacetum coccineum]